MIQVPRRTIGLDALVASLDGATVRGSLEREIAGIAHDSRKVRPGQLFVALRGMHADGHDFAAKASAAGAVAVVAELGRAETLEMPQDVTLVAVPDTRLALARLDSTFFGQPAHSFTHVVGITGTNGKTTTTFLAQAVLEAAGMACGRIGTLGAQFGAATWQLEQTTPFASELQETLATFRARGARAVAMEVSSHSLALERVAEMNFSHAILTNVTRDHLDFHATFEDYVAQKRKLFEGAKLAIFNVDDAIGRRWAGESPGALTYGFADDAQVRATSVVLAPGGSAFAVDGMMFTVRLPGRFNVSNALAALALARSLGISNALAARALASVDSVPGRMEHFAAPGVDVLVDYAHTPDALANVLRAARQAAQGRVVALFGCGGDRDRGKRPEMGRIAAELADAVLVTSDNPRSEDPRAIVDEIVAGVPDRGALEVELDRATAIRRAIAEARPGDVVVVAGKGHETYQIVGIERRHFDDREVVRAALAERASPLR